VVQRDSQGWLGWKDTVIEGELIRLRAIERKDIKKLRD